MPMKTWKIKSLINCYKKKITMKKSKSVSDCVTELLMKTTEEHKSIASKHYQKIDHNNLNNLVHILVQIVWVKFLEKKEYSFWEIILICKQKKQIPIINIQTIIIISIIIKTFQKTIIISF